MLNNDANKPGLHNKDNKNNEANKHNESKPHEGFWNRMKMFETSNNKKDKKKRD